jgi:hypothetical protein
LAFGIDFGADRICEAEDPDYGIQCHRAKSQDDFHGKPFRNFHKAMLQCFATAGSSAYPGRKFLNKEDNVEIHNLALDGSRNTCDLRFDNVPPAE